jgi:hypothetical protein
VGRGLRHLHGGGVLHRDLAARNVLKKRDGQCKVTDFGLSSVVSDTDAARMTSTTIGPVAWRAPETFHHDDAGRQIASVATDVYMLGGLMFEVLTAGRHAPFFWMSTERLIMLRGSSPMNALDVAMAAGVSIPWAIVPGDDWSGAVDGVERLKALMSRCLHADPSRRPSMDDFLAELDAIRGPSSVHDSGYGGATDGGYGGAVVAAPRAVPSTSATPAPAVAADASVSAATATSAQLFDMNDASDAVAALQVPADVLNRVCGAIADVADELGNVTGAQLLRIVVDEGVEASLAMALRRKLNIAAPVPRRRVRCCGIVSASLHRHVAALLRRIVFAVVPRCVDASMSRGAYENDESRRLPCCVRATLSCWRFYTATLRSLLCCSAAVCQL